MKKLYFSSALILTVSLAPANCAGDGAAHDQFVEAVRQQVLSHVGALPNFICIRERVETAQLGVSLDNYPVDDSRVEVSYYGRQEHYRPLKEGPAAPEIGVISMGEFGGTLHLIFEPSSKAIFVVKGQQTIRGHKTVRIDFQAPQEGSRLSIMMGERRVFVAYQGSCWADQESKQIVRLQVLVRTLPKDLNIQKAAQSIEYDRVKIGEGTYWLPVSAASETYMVANAGDVSMDLAKAIFGFSRPGISWDKAMVKNLVKFKDYRKFEAESKLLP